MDINDLKVMKLIESRKCSRSDLSGCQCDYHAAVRELNWLIVLTNEVLKDVTKNG